MTTTTIETDVYGVSEAGREVRLTVADLKKRAATGRLRPDEAVRGQDGEWVKAGDVPGVFSRKAWLTALLLSLFLGGLGVDRFYLGKVGSGVGKLLTLGGLGVWSLVDFIMIAANAMRDGQDLPLRR